MDKLQDWKKRGNEFFKQQEYLKAINCWEEAVQIAKAIEEEYQSLVQIKKDDNSQQTID